MALAARAAALLIPCQSESLPPCLVRPLSGSLLLPIATFVIIPPSGGSFVLRLLQSRDRVAGLDQEQEWTEWTVVQLVIITMWALG